MPQTLEKNDGGVSKKVADAKKALDAAKNNPKVGTKSGHSYIGDPPKTPVPVAPEVPKSPSTGLLGEAESAGEGLKAFADQAKDVPKMHAGGEVEKDGPVILKKGEIVLPKDKDKAEKMAMEKLGKKAKGVMSSALDEVDDEKDEPKEEEKHETKKEEKAEGHKSAKKEEKKPAGKKHVGFHGYSHKGGHVVHHMYDDGSSETNNFALGDHAGVGANIADVLGSQAPQSAEGSGQGGGSPEPEPAKL